jgi:hypothetical protein
LNFPAIVSAVRRKRKGRRWEAEHVILVPLVSDAGIVSAFLLPLKDGEWSGRMHRAPPERKIFCAVSFARG